MTRLPEVLGKEMYLSLGKCLKDRSWWPFDSRKVTLDIIWQNSIECPGLP